MAILEFQGKSFDVDEDGFCLSLKNGVPNGLSSVKKAKASKNSTKNTRKLSTSCRTTTRKMVSHLWFVSFPKLLVSN